MALPRITHTQKQTQKKKDRSTSWGGVASWYSAHVSEEDTYHTQVILPYVLKLFSGYQHVRTVLEIGCGEGFFARALVQKGYTVSASDISPELIALAKKKNADVRWFVAPGEKQESVGTASQDVILAVLTLQNMRRLDAVCKEISRSIAPGGRFVCVLNHPAFRIPKASSWGFVGKKGGAHSQESGAEIQYRRVDAYMSEFEVGIDMHPGASIARSNLAKKTHKKETVSFHRPLSTYVNTLTKHGLSVTRLDELVSHRHSVGTRALAENKARKEIPLFMVIEATAPVRGR